jgi:serine/threonine-protein kinase
MNVPDALVLPKDVLLVPVAELPEESRQQFRSAHGDYALTRLHSRTLSKIVGPEVARLLQEFKTPRSIVDAVINYSTAREVDPEDTLEEVYPIIANFISARILVHPDSDDATRIRASHRIGDTIDEFEVQQCVQVLEDSEVYHVRSRTGADAALKIARVGCGSAVERAFDREADCLKRLDGRFNPKLLGSGVVDGRKYLALEWCEGVPATVAAEELRSRTDERENLLRLCLSIATAYAHLHSQSLIHCDVHPGNILVDHTGNVRILDYGLSRFDDAGPNDEVPRRGGIGFYLEPEFAVARLHGSTAPAATRQSDQYGLAAVLYLLISGVHYLDFSYEKMEMARQIAECAPAPLSTSGCSWPRVEAVLLKALSKSPSERFSSLSELRDALSELVTEEDLSVARASRRSSLDQAAARSLVENVLCAIDEGSEVYSKGLPAAPVSSVTYGASGLSYALYRISCIRSDPKLLALADVWSDRAASALSASDAFYNRSLEITPDTVGRTALYHTASGVHAVEAIVGQASGNFGAAQAAVDNYMAASRRPCENLDLTLGRSSTLVGCALLHDALSGSEYTDLGLLVSFGDETLADIWRQLDHAPPMADPDGVVSYLGIAHGWAGMLYAALLWCSSANRDLPVGARQRLSELAQCAEPKGRGVHWKIKLGVKSASSSNYTAGWCNGSAGQVFLWTLAHRVLGDDHYLALAERAAWNAWEDAYASDSLCCGLAGEAYGLMNLYKYTSDEQWLLRAHDLANRAIKVTTSSSFPNSLYKGTLGVAVLLADMLEGNKPCMPLFELQYAGDQ